MINYVNTTSLSAVNDLSRYQSGIAKSIQKISSGLRINSASDDPTAFTMSERMRSDIMGYKQASLNTQTGTSYLQTAEGALTEVTNIMGRMRELAVQGSNGTYSNSDREVMQIEIDELKSEIDRISDTTEFNSVKLLSGKATGDLMSSSSNIGGSITGAVGDANYDVSLNVKPGLNQVQKSNLMVIGEGSLGAEIKGAFVNPTNVITVSDPKNIPISGTGSYTLNVTNPTVPVPPGGVIPDSSTIAGKYSQDGSNFETGATISSISTTESGYFMVEFLEDDSTAGDIGTKYRVKFVSSITGEDGEWKDFSSAAAGSLSGSYTSRGITVDFAIPITTTPATSAAVKQGDKFMYAVSDMKGLAGTEDLGAVGGGIIQVGNGDITSPSIVFTATNSLTPQDNNDGKLDVNNVTVHMAAIDKDGSFQLGEMTVGFQENTPTAGTTGVTLMGAVEIAVKGPGDIATATTKLSELKNFIREDGINILSSPQEIQISSNGKKHTIYLDPSDTIETFNSKIQQALMNDLEMDSGNAVVNKNVVKYNNTASGDTDYFSVPGTIVLQSPILGKDGDISFTGSEDIMKALGFNEIQTSKDSINELEMINSHTGASGGVITFTGSRVENAVGGVELTIDPRTGVDASFDRVTGEITFAKSDSIESRFMTFHTSDKGKKMQIGINKEDVMNLALPEITVKALDLQNMSVLSSENAQESISKMDKAISKVSMVRTTVGAQINRLASSYDTLQSLSENLTTADGNIRNLDIAIETSNYANLELMMQASTAILSKANQLPEMAMVLLQGR